MAYVLIFSQRDTLNTARVLRSKLSNTGFNVWLDERYLLEEYDNFRDVFRDLIASADVLVFMGEAVQSNNPEVAAAVQAGKPYLLYDAAESVDDLAQRLRTLVSRKQSASALPEFMTDDDVLVLRRRRRAAQLTFWFRRALPIGVGVVVAAFALLLIFPPAGFFEAVQLFDYTISATEVVEATQAAATQKAIDLTATAAAPTPFIDDGRGALPQFREIEGATVGLLGDLPMVAVQAGCFVADAEGAPDICIDPFWIGFTEVTNGQYAACVAAGGCTPPVITRSRLHEDYYANPTFADHPVVGVTWEQAQVYADWVGGFLPSRDEWRFAAHGTEKTFYPWGEAEPTPNLANFGNAIGDTVIVDSLPEGKSWVGALGMAGNAWEWTRTHGVGETRVIVGGSWSSPAELIRADSSSSVRVGDANFSIGFRIAAALDSVTPVTD